MERARVPLVRDLATGNIAPESGDGNVARQTLGEQEYWDTAGRRIQYVGFGRVAEHRRGDTTSD